MENSLINKKELKSFRKWKGYLRAKLNYKNTCILIRDLELKNSRITPTNLIRYKNFLGTKILIYEKLNNLEFKEKRSNFKETFIIAYCSNCHGFLNYYCNFKEFDRCNKTLLSHFKRFNLSNIATVSYELVSIKNKDKKIICRCGLKTEECFA